MAGDLVKFETTPKHSSAPNPAERAIQAVEEQSRTIRADCQMRFGSSETYGADKPIWAWLLRHAGWQLSRYKQKGNGMTACKQAYGEHYTHEVVLFAEVVLVRVPKPTHRGLQGGIRWHKGNVVFIKGVWVGRSETSDEHIFLTPGGRAFSRTIRRLEPSRRHDDGFLDKVKGLHRTVLYGVDRERKLHHPLNTQSHNSDLPDKTEETHSETPKDPQRSKETVKQGETRESNTLPGESPERKKVRFLSDSGDGGTAAVTVEELVEDCWSDEPGQREMFEGLHCKVEPDLDMINTEAALERLLENEVVRDIPRAEETPHHPVGENLEETQQRVGVHSSLRGARIQMAGGPGRPVCPGVSYCTGRIVDILSLKRRVPTFTLDCTDAFHQAPGLDDVVVEPPEQYLNRLRAADMSLHICGSCRSNCRVDAKLVNNGLITSRLHWWTNWGSRCACAHRNSSGIKTVRWGWRCTWMTCTVFGQTHKWRSSRKILRPTCSVMAASIAKVRSTIT